MGVNRQEGCLKWIPNDRYEILTTAMGPDFISCSISKCCCCDISREMVAIGKGIEGEL